LRIEVASKACSSACSALDRCTVFESTLPSRLSSPFLLVGSVADGGTKGGGGTCHQQLFHPRWTRAGRTGGKNHRLQPGKHTIAAKKQNIPATAYPKAQQMKYAAQKDPVLHLSCGSHDMSRWTSRIPIIEDGPTAANTRSRFDLSVSECEGRWGRVEGRRSGSIGGRCVAGCNTCVICYRQRLLGS